MKGRRACLLGLCLAVTGMGGPSARAVEPPPSAAVGSNGPSANAAQKSSFHLFNPTPRELMREMSTDRPDTTESPYTVDAGHVQVELSLLDYAYEDEQGVRSETLAVLPTNVKLGLLNNVDVQFVFEPYVHARFEGTGGNDSIDGFGDGTQVRLKINLWGNDGAPDRPGETAFAVMPFVKVPTGSGDLSNDHVEGGVILPFAVELPNDFALGLMAEVDVRYDEASGDYGVAFVHTATIGHDIPGIANLAGYVEYVGIAPHDLRETYQAIGSAGLTYQVNDDWMLDCGGTVGLSESADDFTLFVGTSFRI